MCCFKGKEWIYFVVCKVDNLTDIHWLCTLDGVDLLLNQLQRNASHFETPKKSKKGVVYSFPRTFESFKRCFKEMGHGWMWSIVNLGNIWERLTCSMWFRFWMCWCIFHFEKQFSNSCFCGSRLNATVLQFILIPMFEIMSTQVFLLLFFPFCKVGMIHLHFQNSVCFLYPP